MFIIIKSLEFRMTPSIAEKNEIMNGNIYKMFSIFIRY